MNQKFKPRGTSRAITAFLLSGVLTGCGTVLTEVQGLEKNTADKISTAHEKAAEPQPVVSSTPTAWLMGQAVQVAPTRSPLLSGNVTYHPTQRVTLADVASWITEAKGLVVDTAEAQPPTTTGQSTTGLAPGYNAPTVPPLPTGTPMGLVSPVGPATQTSASSQPVTMSISYEGPLSGLLDYAANKAGVWWKFSEGRVVFYRTETKTFYLPAISRKSTGGSSITTASGGSGASGAPGASGSTGNTASGGATSTSDYVIDVWGDLEKTAKTVGGGAQVVANASLGSLTVTGTPRQVRDVEEWAKTLSENLNQQVSITVQIYNVKVTKEDNYNWSPAVVFSSLTGGSLTLTGPQAPVPVSGLTPLSLVANAATGSQFQGSQLAVRALSTVGRVTETLRQTVVTLNGQPAPIQVANQRTYLASSTPGTAAAGSSVPVAPTLTPGQLTTGFTGMFLPRVVNGKILLTMHIVSSTLVSMGSITSDKSLIQTPNVDTSTFPQSVMLTPGDSLLLTGLRLDTGNANNSGIGTPENYLLGGGVDNNSGKQLIAIVITAKVL